MASFFSKKFISEPTFALFCYLTLFYLHLTFLFTSSRLFQSFLQNLNPPVSVDDEKIIRWHPKFHVDDVPDVAEAELPQPPVVKTYNSAHDVLEKAHDMIAPRVRRLHYISQNTTYI